MRRKLMLALALSGGRLPWRGCGRECGSSTTLRAGDLVVTFGGSTSPKALPKKNFAPVDDARLRQDQDHRRHPSARRSAKRRRHRQEREVNTKGFPVCKAGQLEARDTKAAKRVCGKPDRRQGQRPRRDRLPRTEADPGAEPAARLQRRQQGRQDDPADPHLHHRAGADGDRHHGDDQEATARGSVVAKIPVIAGGSGSALDFDFKLGKTYRYKGKKHSYFEARCPDGKFKVRRLRRCSRTKPRCPASPRRPCSRADWRFPARRRASATRQAAPAAKAGTKGPAARPPLLLSAYSPCCSKVCW